MDLGEAQFEPFAGLAYVHVDTDGFTEQGGPAALTARDESTGLAYSTLGLRASREIVMENGRSLTPHATLAWRHAFGNVSPAATLAFASGSPPFTVEGTPLARDAAIVELGLDVEITDDISAGLLYSGVLANDIQDSSFRLDLSWKF